MTRFRPLLQVLVAIVMIAAGSMLSDAHAHAGHAHAAHAHAGHAHGMTPVASTAPSPAAAAVDLTAPSDGDLHTESGPSQPGKAHAGCCCAGPCCAVLAGPVGLPVRAAHPARPGSRPADPARPDALSEALPRPPRFVA
ncbi:hypothetical protein [Methylobacterium isbiliense]|jgi:hypothetical protein|uniref:CopL family metal-binding regulatory protein n=1 Tax=Methylobacterium isbiliense TaxID=315478 RepID=A0ABQ4SC55_9HYPH|nr:hypothetical protein [Methylobacterium isbiliense]MDN3621551.1 hypothetical protein [Methylobacterium isbiliense]GJE00806.1 hypothetical protein GMJLKIPL_2733 [Methylobacterium isbiliense]